MDDRIATMTTKEKVHNMKYNLELIKQYEYNLIDDSKLLFLDAMTWYRIELWRQSLCSVMCTMISNVILSQSDKNSIGKDKDFNRSKLNKIKLQMCHCD